MIDIGLVGTEMLYFAVGHLGLDGGIQVTASHNPKEYTGMKVVRRGALPVGGDSGLLDIRDRALSSSATPRDQVPGQVREEDVFPAFVDKVLSFVDPDLIQRQRVVIDAANGMGGVMLPPVLERHPDRRRPLLLRARRHVPEPRAEPAPAREPRVRDRQGARGRTPTSERPSTATPTAASSSTTPASSCPATS